MDIDEATLDQTQKLFKSLPAPDQIGALYEMLRYIRGEVAIIKRDQIDIREDLRSLTTKSTNEAQTTTDKIKRIIGERFDLMVYFRDKVLPPVITAIILVLLILAFERL